MPRVATSVRLMTLRRLAWTLSLAPLACTQDAAVADSLGFGESGGDSAVGSSGGVAMTDSGGTTGSVDTGGNTTAAEDESDSDEPIYDVGSPDGGPDRPMQCKLDEDGDISGIGPCDGGPLAESYNAEVQWAWGEGEAGVLTTPLVANLTDDNDDDSIDLCDTPDVIALARLFQGGMMVEPEKRMYALDGETGTEHWSFQAEFVPSFGPALGDIDDDGFVEIVAVTRAAVGSDLRLIALSHDGQLEWETPGLANLNEATVTNISLADIDADGDVEILAGNLIADHMGLPLVTVAAGNGGFAVDLDDDGDLEYVHAGGASHHDGTPYFTHIGGGVSFPHVADIDGDGLPEIVYSQHPSEGLAIYEHDGTPVASDLLGAISGLPGALHDMNGDGIVDLAVGHGDSVIPTFSVIDILGGSAVWTTDTIGGCCAGGTAFDFLGDTTAESIFADDQLLFVFDEVGDILTSAPRQSPTVGDYPVVADVDNDGSAEIVVAGESFNSPAIQVLRDANDGWVPARRIWNQYHYHVTNVREDGTIPTIQPKNWESLNTFRTQAQISPGGVCVPAG